MARRAFGLGAEWRWSRAWTALAWFWAVLVLGLGSGAGVLQILGPPPRQTVHLSGPMTPGTALEPGAADAAHAPVPPAAVPAPAAGPPPAAEQRAGASGTLPELLESAGEGGGGLPRIGPNGRMPMQAYAAVAQPPDSRPRVAILLAGIGMATTDSEDAIRTLPKEISFAISPYASGPTRVADLARAAGHETLVSLPMEPTGYPLNDAGDHAMLTGLSPEQNHARLVWALSRIQGYVGATAAMSGLRGERFADTPQMGSVLQELSGRGLLYIDPRPQAVAAQPGARAADVLIDEPAVRSEIEAKLARLEQVARDRGSALGLVGVPNAVTVERLAAWATRLGMRGLVLVPVSALVAPPEVDGGRTATSAPR